MTEQERAAARRWLEWANDTGKEVIRSAELSARGFGEADMRTLLHMAFQAGAHAQWVADAVGGRRLHAPPRAWIGPRGQLMPAEVYEAWAKAYPDQASEYEALR